MWYVVVAIVAFVLFIIFIATTAGMRFFAAFQKYDLIKSSRGIKAEEFLSQLANSEPKCNSKLALCRITGTLTDCYIPKKRTIALSESTYHNDSVAALAVATHEFGHAMQHSEKSTLYSINRALAIFYKIFGKLILPLVIIGLILLPFRTTNYYGYILLYVGGGLLVLILLFRLITIPLEYNASRRAMLYLSRYEALNEKELKMARKLLDKAALTYIAEFLSIITGINLIKRRNS